MALEELLDVVGLSQREQLVRAIALDLEANEAVEIGVLLRVELGGEGGIKLLKDRLVG